MFNRIYCSECTVEVSSIPVHNAILVAEISKAGGIVRDRMGFVKLFCIGDPFQRIALRDIVVIKNVKIVFRRKQSAFICIQCVIYAVRGKYDGLTAVNEAWL